MHVFTRAYEGAGYASLCEHVRVRAGDGEQAIASNVAHNRSRNTMAACSLSSLLYRPGAGPARARKLSPSRWSTVRRCGMSVMVRR